MTSRLLKTPRIPVIVGLVTLSCIAFMSWLSPSSSPSSNISWIYRMTGLKDKSKSVEKRNEDCFFLRIIVLTFNRPKGLVDCFKSLSEADYVGDRVDVDIWIDRNKDNVLDEETYQTALSFQWPHGHIKVHPHSKHVGIYGQWLTTWSPTNSTTTTTTTTTCSQENALFLEDDIIVSKAFYKWLKTMHKLYADRTDFSGFSLQSNDKVIKMGGRDVTKHLAVPNHHPIYLYRILGTWGFSPVRRVWAEFLTWYDLVKDDPSFHPYVDGILPTGWYRGFEATAKRKGRREDTMWSMWFIYYTHVKGLYCLYKNGPGGLSVNQELPGLHFSTLKKVSTEGLVQNWSPIRAFVADPVRIRYDGSIVDNGQT